jgi:hypothetical protein
LAGKFAQELHIGWHMKTSIMKAFGIVLLGSSSCALLSQGTKEQISVTSEPSGATATLSDGRTYLTPFSVTVPREQDLQIHFAKSGYQSTDLTDASHMEGIYVAPDMLTFIGFVIDASTGAYFAHDQSTIVGRLDPNEKITSGTNSETAPPSAQKF